MFCLGGFCPGGFWQGGFLSRGFLSGGLCPGGFCPGGFCPRTIKITNDKKDIVSFWGPIINYERGGLESEVSSP